MNLAYTPILIFITVLNLALGFYQTDYSAFGDPMYVQALLIGAAEAALYITGAITIGFVGLGVLALRDERRALAKIHEQQLEWNCMHYERNTCERSIHDPRPVSTRNAR